MPLTSHEAERLVTALTRRIRRRVTLDRLDWWIELIPAHSHLQDPVLTFRQVGAREDSTVFVSLSSTLRRRLIELAEQDRTRRKYKRVGYGSR